ncbi:MAG: hypothetical protein WD963_00365 [Candidatus Paceibacterota bacterium]
MINFEKNQKRKGFQAECVREEPCGAVPRLAVPVVQREKDDLPSQRHREHDRNFSTRMFCVASLHSWVQAPKEEASCPVTEMDLCQDDAEVGESVESTHSLRPDRGVELKSTNPHLHLHRVEQNEKDEKCCKFQIAPASFLWRSSLVQAEDQRFYRHLPCKGKPADELGKTFHFGLPFWFVVEKERCSAVENYLSLNTYNIAYMSLKVKLNRKSPYFKAFSRISYWIKKFSSPKIKIWFKPMFFSGFFCGFERCGSAAFRNFRRGIFSEKCVRTNSRILHQKGKVKEFWFASQRFATNWYSILGVKTNSRFRILGEENFLILNPIKL